MSEQSTALVAVKEPTVCGKMIRLTVGGKAHWINIEHLISVESPPSRYTGGSWINSVKSPKFWASESPEEVVAMVRAASPPDIGTIVMLTMMRETPKPG